MRNKVIIIFLLVFTIHVKSQNKQQKWTAGISLAGAKYTLEAGKIVGGQVAFQVPRINISRYIFKGLSLDFGFATLKASLTNLHNTLPITFETSLAFFTPTIDAADEFAKSNSFGEV